MSNDYAASGPNEKDVKKKITPGVWNFILRLVDDDETIKQDEITSFAGLLGTYTEKGGRFKGQHTRGKKEGVKAMKAILEDWWMRGNLTELDTNKAIGILIDIFKHKPYVVFLHFSNV